jgi:dTDP-4-amino-4,6-dideoxygalactose transaminase
MTQTIVRVPYSYLPEQFGDIEPILAEWRRVVAKSEYTLGPWVEAFETKFAAFVGAKHVISTNTGTDALILALRAVGVGTDDEVITVTNTFYATVGAIVAVGARPVFVDCDERYQINPARIPEAITAKTKAILPVHWAGCSPDMPAIMDLADMRGIAVVEDACPAVGASIQGRHAGTFGVCGAFSMHPLKPLNVMGDGGMVATDRDDLADWMRKYRNHGMVDRDHIDFWGVNMRLQPLQAVVASRVLDTVPEIVARRTENAKRLDAGLAQLHAFVRVPVRPAGHVEAYQLYQASFARRDELLRFLVANGIEAKVHYPLPLHLQRAAAGLGYKRGDFPVSERQAEEIMTIPAHQYITPMQIDYVIDETRRFYATA